MKNKKIGIYTIKNLVNGKMYVGQSRDIFKRWRQHTYKVWDEREATSRIRAALRKYGLNKTVGSPGIHGNFEFIIVEECSEERLLEREADWINKHKPEYNCALHKKAAFFTKKESLGKRFWVQYHNYDQELGYPSDEILTALDDTLLEDSTHYISSLKRSMLYALGDTVFLIVGRYREKKKQYYLWTKTVIEEVDYIETENLVYNAFGEQCFVSPPAHLNNIDGFDEFLVRIGRFGFGFHNISHLPFTDKLIDVSSDNENAEVTYKNYVKSFEIENGFSL